MPPKEEQYYDQHKWKTWVGFLLIFLAILIYFFLIGYVTGSSETSGSGGSMLTSSGDNSSNELFTTFISLMFLGLGVYLLTSTTIIKNASKKLVDSAADPKNPNDPNIKAVGIINGVGSGNISTYASETLDYGKSVSNDLNKQYEKSKEYYNTQKQNNNKSKKNNNKSD